MAQNWKQPEHPATGEWINKLTCMHTLLLFSDKKEGTTDPHRNVGKPQTLCYMKETRYRGQHTVSLSLFEILEEAKLQG